MRKEEMYVMLNSYLKSRHKLFILFSVLILALGSIGIVLAVHDLPLFELDRNAIDDGSVDGDDWDTPPAPGGSAVEFTGIIPDLVETNPLGSTGTQFQAGGSKDEASTGSGTRVSRSTRTTSPTPMQPPT
jgi:hypothetical protein